MKKLIIILVLSVASVSTTTSAQSCDDKYDVPYVPTDNEIVETMLEMAHVTENDVLYDLGCGDGRIVIAAAKKYGARGVGIDINPLRIGESNKNAQQEGVTDKVRFIEQNFFEADISAATVLTMYLLPKINLQLRPRLFRDLRPGTRIVSHDFHMGEWDPDQSTVMDGGYDAESSFDNHTVYCWVLPANVSGTWKLTVSDMSGLYDYILNVEQHFQKLQGTFTNKGESIPVKSLKIAGYTLQFMVGEKDTGEANVRLFHGTVKGNYLSGTVKTNDGDHTFKAMRYPSTIIPLDVPYTN